MFEGNVCPEEDVVCDGGNTLLFHLLLTFQEVAHCAVITSSVCM